MKKFICIVLTVVLALSCMSAFAAEPLSSQEGGTTTQESITPFWVNTLSIIPSISGSAGTYSCSINGVSGTTKISATLVLYEKGWLGGYTEKSAELSREMAMQSLFLQLLNRKYNYSRI